MKKTKLQNINIHNAIQSPEILLFLTSLAFLVSGYFTFRVFTSDCTGFDFFIGIIKTLVVEACKIIFYIAQRNKSTKKDLFFWLWMFFLILSLMHSMNYEISKINNNSNNIMKNSKSYLDNSTSLEQLRKDKVNKQDEIDNYIIEKNKRIENIENNYLETNKSLNAEKQNKKNALKQQIEQTENSYNKKINGYSNKYITKKNNLRSERDAEVSKLNKKLIELESNINNKSIKQSKENEKEIYKQSNKIQENIDTAKLELKEINAEIKSREGKDFTAEQTEIKNIEGLNPILDIITTSSTKKRILIFIITLLVSLSIDLAGCKLYQLYEEKTNTNEQILNESNKSSIGFIPEPQLKSNDITMQSQNRIDTNLEIGKSEKVEKVDLVKKNKIGFKPPEKISLSKELINTKQEPEQNKKEEINKSLQNKELVKVEQKLESNLSKLTKLDFLKFISALYNPSTMYLKKYGTGYKKINDMTKLDSTKVKKIRDCLEMLEIIETEKLQQGKRLINVTKLKISKQEALKKIFKIGGML